MPMAPVRSGIQPVRVLHTVSVLHNRSSVQGASGMGVLRGSTNCFGQVIAAAGLRPLARSLGVPPWVATTRTSGFDGSERLRLEGPDLDFETQPLGGAEHLLNGEIGGEREAALATLERLSRTLANAGVVHRLELYDEADTQVACFEHGWRERAGRVCK